MKRSVAGEKATPPGGTLPPSETMQGPDGTSYGVDPFDAKRRMGNITSRAGATGVASRTYGKGRVGEAAETELEETKMKINHEQVDLAIVEMGSVLLRLQRAGLTETESRLVVQRITELDELPVSCDEKMWNHGGPKGDESSAAAKRTELHGGAVKEGPDDAPDTKRDDGEDAPDTEKNPHAAEEGFDRFMDQILVSEGRKEIKRSTNLPDSPGMLHAKRYGEKAHNRIVWKK